uniref:Variant surface glycoprotein 457 n=1 Tax=Trypanosoma brucei TaxID=5691 RepID=M4SX34_9TRYP|nr:variant surface glycoprotein 457 [Trypanosoma brucei]
MTALALYSLTLVIVNIDSAADTANSAAGAFSVLCDLINLARQLAPKAKTVDDLADFEETAALINISLAAPSALQQLKNAKLTGGELKTEEEPLKTHCAGEAALGCKLAKVRLDKPGKGRLPSSLWSATAGTEIKDALNATVGAMRSTLTQLKQALGQTSDPEIPLTLAQALGAKPNNQAGLQTVGANTDRATSCGKPATNDAGSAAGKNLAMDAICICGSEGGGGETNQACGLQTAIDNVVFSSESTPIHNQWHSLAEQCKNKHKAKALTSANLATALNRFDIQRSRGQGTNEVLNNLIGHIKGSGVTGCDGKEGTNPGACVYYGKNANNKSPLDPEWYTKLQDVRSKLDATAAAANKAETLEQRLRTLNDTLTSFMHLTTPAATATAHSQQKAGDKAVHEAIDKECEQHKNNKTACTEAKCKWKGKTDTEGDCKPKETGSEGRTGTSDGAAGTTTEKCKGKLEDACKKAPECKWDGKESKDSSTLVITKFALALFDFVSFLSYEF